MGGFPGSVSELGYSGATEVQTAIAQLFVSVGGAVDLEAIGNNLKAKSIVDGQLATPPLPNDQWVQELKGFESSVWAMLQIAISDYAIGASVRDLEAAKLMRSNITSGEQRLCGMQKMMNPGGYA